MGRNYDEDSEFFDSASSAAYLFNGGMPWLRKKILLSSDLIYTGKTVSLRVDTVEVPNKGYQKEK